MRFLTVAITFLAPLVAADFWVARLKEPHRKYTAHRALFFKEQPDCDDVTKWAKWFYITGDVSGNKHGVRISGWWGNDDPAEIEWNNEMGHFTIYKNRNYAMIDVNGTQQGQCRRDLSWHFDCFDASDLAPVTGHALAFCESSSDTSTFNDPREWQ
ncbi:hypothetical protein F4780DRAFT_87363 [Xylariomycetidae sp. FL0641]|nr:hypothetical protein F4780DRAFT_87363 [Xylariomycetidae sp. FL0641]